LNIIGWSDYSPIAYILAANVPAPPPKPTYKNSTSTNISILIRRSEDDGGSPITGYKLFVDAGNNFNSEFSQVLSYIDSGSTHTTLDSDNL
jgi:hypothetical protein